MANTKKNKQQTGYLKKPNNNSLNEHIYLHTHLSNTFLWDKSKLALSKY